MSNKNNTYLSSKPRYEILDGLRGVAAMLVVVFHIFETYSAGPLYQVINHGYLAVDFFFVLSGFVIGYAYDDRWDRMSTWNFVKRRLIRLHPMVVFSMLLGLLLFYFGGGKAFPAVDHASAGMVLLVLPRIGGETHMWMNGLYECLCILCVFPLLVMTGAGSKVTDSRSMAVCKWLGEISYPLYISHFPFLYLQMAWKSCHENTPLMVHVIVGVSVFLLAVLTAWAAYKMYDVPVREWLKKKLYSK